ncbi:MAG: pseudaminic acid cytidylyltransferase [Gammaproteobacteria bacterium]
MNAIAIIPARGGSRRIPRKNLRGFHGQPILGYSIRTAHDCGLFAEIMVSTENDEIAEIARGFGATIPFRRSPATAGDFATTLDVLREVIAGYRAQGRQFETLCCLYPTAVLTDPETLKAGYTLLSHSRDAACVVPVVRYGHPVQRALAIRGGRLAPLQPEFTSTRSQDLEPTYHDAGQWYWMRTRTLDDPDFAILGPATVPLVLDAMQVQDIDDEQDWAMAEAKYTLLRRRRAR